MSNSALIESLRSQAARDVEQLWTDARAEAGRHRTALAEIREQERGRIEQATEAELSRLRAEAAAQAAHRARELRAGAMLELGERLQRLARAALPRLRQEAQGRLFDALASELPARDWQRVRVNAADTGAAARIFPAAVIEVDPAISAGLEVECEDGAIRISNTLDARLDAAWPDLLPRLIAGLERRSASHGPAA